MRLFHEPQAYPQQFDEFWKAYPTDKNMGKLEAFAAWRKLTHDERVQAVASVPDFRAYCASHPDYRPIHACRYLTYKRFEGFVAVKAISTGHVFVQRGTDAWRAWEAWYRENKSKSPPTNKENTGWWFPSERPA